MLEKVEYCEYCHVAGKCRGSAHQSCNVNIQLTSKILVIFHDLRRCDCHHVMQEIVKIGQKISIMLNCTEKYMAFILGKKLFFIDKTSMKGGAIYIEQVY